MACLDGSLRSPGALNIIIIIVIIKSLSDIVIIKPFPPDC